MVRRFPAIACLLALPGAAPATDGGAIEVTVENIRSDEGQVFVQLCPRAEFLGTCAIGARARARRGDVTLRFAAVPPGDYAAMAFHDSNGNGALDRRFGIPREDFGFSRMDHVPRLPPRFRDYSFTHGPADQKVAVRLSSYFG